MRVFELYMKRIFKRKLTFLLMILLPVMFTFMVVTQYNEASKVNLAMYVKDKTLNTYVTQMLKKQNITVTQVKNKEEAINHTANLGIVLDQSVDEIYKQSDEFKVKMYAKETNFNSKSLEIKLNSIFSTLKTLAKNSNNLEEFKGNMKDTETAISSIEVKPSILGNQNAVVLTSTFNMIVFVMVFLTMTNTLLFLRDKVHTTTQRILLSAKNKLSYCLQTVGVFAAIGVAQFVLMLVLMTTVFKIDLAISTGELFLLILAYGLLNMIAAGLGLLLISRTTKLSTGRLLVTVVSLPLAMLGGTLWPAAIMPDGMQTIAKILPTYWVTEINTQMFSGFAGSGNTTMVYFSSLLACTCLIFFLLTRVKSGDI